MKSSENRRLVPDISAPRAEIIICSWRLSRCAFRNVNIMFILALTRWKFIIQHISRRKSAPRRSDFCCTCGKKSLVPVDSIAGVEAEVRGMWKGVVPQKKSDCLEMI